MPPTNERLNVALGELAEIDATIVAYEEQIDALKARKNALETGTLIELFNELQVREVVYDPTGKKAKRELVATGGLNKDPVPRAEAIQLICSWGFEDTIENTVTASYARGSRERAMATYQSLRSGDNAAKVKFEEGLHPSTLKKIALDRLRAGLEVPFTTLGLDVTSRVRFSKR